MVGVLKSMINSRMDSRDSSPTRSSSRRSGVVELDRRLKETRVERRAR